MIDDHLRRVGPSAMTDAERDLARLELQEVMRSDRPANRPPAPPLRGRRRRTAALAVAGAVLASATAAAAYAGLVRPDPQQVNVITDKAQDVAEVHSEGWRPELNAELVSCTSGMEAGRFEVYASSVPLAGTVTAEDLVAACVEKASTLGESSQPDRPTICRSGRDEAPTFAAPTVVLGASSCAAAGLADFTDEDVADLNQARATEVALLAIADPCPSRDDALNWTRQQTRRTGADLTLVDSRAAGAPPKVCFGTYVDWAAGTATVDVIAITD
jgi:hypothetical protein